MGVEYQCNVAKGVGGQGLPPHRRDVAGGGRPAHRRGVVKMVECSRLIFGYGCMTRVAAGERGGRQC